MANIAYRRTEPRGFPGSKQHRAVATDPMFRRLLGEAAWRRLDPDVRARFAVKPVAGEMFVFTGVMSVVRCSWFGWLVAQITRLIGTPLAFQQGRDIPTEVRVFGETGGAGIVWERRYDFGQGRLVAVRSTKRADPPSGLLECAGRGFAMRLRLFENAGALHFVSTRYCFDIGRWRISVPDLLTPGEAHVVHSDEGDGWFRFTMSFHHAWFGESFFQEGRFREAGARRG